MKKKSLILVLALALIVATVAGGTLAWLMDVTDPVTNTFTVGDIDITLDESEDNWSKQVIPGYTYEKDPVVTVSANSVDCYLFVKFEEVNNPADYFDYESTLTAANGWTKLDGTDNVWYRVVKNDDAVKSWNLLKDNTITVNGEKVTKANVNDAANAELIYTAYAHQLYKTQGSEFTPAEAWANLNP